VTPDFPGVKTLRPPVRQLPVLMEHQSEPLQLEWPTFHPHRTCQLMEVRNHWKWTLVLPALGVSPTTTNMQDITTVTNVHNGVPFHGYTPADVSIRQSPNRQLFSVRQSRQHSDAAAVGLSKVSKIIQSGLCLSFCCKFFRGSVRSKSSNSYRFLEIKCDSLCRDPFLWLASPDVDAAMETK